MTLAAGTRLGSYEILAPVGAGGMGEVYRARDPRVGRDVAIKISSEQFTDRFAREIHAVAALDQTGLKPAEEQPSIAVLPFVKISGDKEQEYFSDGLAEEIINALTKIPGLKVTARTSSFAFRG